MKKYSIAMLITAVAFSQEAEEPVDEHIDATCEYDELNVVGAGHGVASFIQYDTGKICMIKTSPNLCQQCYDDPEERRVEFPNDEPFDVVFTVDRFRWSDRGYFIKVCSSLWYNWTED